MTRYKNKITAINENEQYEKLFEKRGINSIEQYRTPEYEFVEEDVLRSIDVYQHIWVQGDSYWALASRFYERPEYWWVIASFNRKPTESHVKIGDVIQIPADLYSALRVV